jgi:5'-3' exonuclease
VKGVRVHLVDGTYELFRHFYGAPPRESSEGGEVGAVRGVVQSVLSMFAARASHVGVATDHVVESFRNDLWPGYKTGEGVDDALMAQFPLLEAALVAMGVVVWPMVELEADDALASAAAVAADDDGVEQVLVCTPDKDLAQCVRGRRVVQLDRRKDVITDEEAVRARYGIGPLSIPDWLALVGDSADGFPGLQGWGKQSASKVLGLYEHLEAIPASVADWEPTLRSAVRSAPKLADRLASEMDDALLFRDLATLRVDRSLLASVDDLAWRGPTPDFEDIARFLRDPALADRAATLASGPLGPGR